MSKLLEKIQNNAFLGMSAKVIGTMDPMFVFVSLVIISGTLAFGTQPWRTEALLVILPSAIQVISSVCVFVCALSIGKMKSGEDISVQSLTIATATLLSVSPILLSVSFAQYALFYAFWVAIFMKFVYLLLKDIKLKGKKVPPAVLSTLSGLIPVLALALCTVGYFALSVQSGTQIVNFTHQLFAIIGSYPVILLSVLTICLIWTSGYHGANIVNRVMRLFWVPMTLVNLATFTMTGQPEFIGTEALITTFVWIGGSGGTLGLSIMLKLFAKSAYMKNIAQESLLPGCFNINEPVIFGVPIVENKRYYIPFFLAPTLMVTLAYFAIHLGFVRYSAYTITWIMPGPLAALIGSFFDWRTMVLALINILVSGLVYLPFILKHDRELLDQDRILN